MIQAAEVFAMVTTFLFCLALKHSHGERVVYGF